MLCVAATKARRLCVSRMMEDISRDRRVESSNQCQRIFWVAAVGQSTYNPMAFYYIYFLPTNDNLYCICYSQQKVFRNYDPALRSQEKAVEYTRALNAAKLEKVRLIFLICIYVLFLLYIFMRLMLLPISDICQAIYWSNGWSH